MLLLVSIASAEGLPWECPPVDIPEDATIYRDADAGLGAIWAALEDTAEVYASSDACTWVGTTTLTEDSFSYRTTTVTEDVCDATGFGVTRTTTERLDLPDPYGTLTLTTTVLLVTVDTGETWTRLQLTESEQRYWESSITSEETTLSAEWVGALDGVPDDSWFSARSSISESVRSSDDERRWIDTPDCSFSWWKMTSEEVYVTESVLTPDRSVWVSEGGVGGCFDGGWPTIATVDGALYGAVDPTTWARDGADADGDGYIATYDCDDTDPGRNPCLGEVANDGIDQDCDGADLVDYDLDNDGVDGTDFGGSDCDDADAGTFPGADDVPYDGVDQDCSGADTTDVDGDGYDAEEAGGPDCDDRQPATHPGAYDPDCDGRDQDCDGYAEECDSGDPEDTDAAEESPGVGAERDTDEAESAEPPPRGCGTGAGAWLLMVPLLRARRQLGRR